MRWKAYNGNVKLLCLKFSFFSNTLHPRKVICCTNRCCCPLYALKPHNKCRHFCGAINAATGCKYIILPFYNFTQIWFHPWTGLSVKAASLYVVYKQNISNIPRSLLQILNFKADNRAAQHPQTQIHAAVNAAGWNFQWAMKYVIS